MGYNRFGEGFCPVAAYSWFIIVVAQDGLSSSTIVAAYYLIIGSCLHVFQSYLLEDWFKFGYAGWLGRLDHVYASSLICYGCHSY